VGGLVVDTGMQYYGWSRDQAIDFMWRTPPLPVPRGSTRQPNIGCGPGLAYMTGGMTIRRLRGAAEGCLGRAFDISAFTDGLAPARCR